jgi:WD40 repeat protein
LYHVAADGLCIANDHVLLHPREAHEWQVVSIATGKKVAKLLSSRSDCVVSPKTPLAALPNDALVDLVDTRTWKMQSIHFAVGDKVGAVAWSPDGTSFVVGYASGVIQRYPAEAAVLKKDKLDKPHPNRAPLAKLANSISGLAFTADGKELIVADVDGVHLLDATTGTEVARLSRLPGARDLTALPDGQHIVGTAADIGSQRWMFLLRLGN